MIEDRPKWQTLAACIGKPEFFFDDMKRTQVSKAKKICSTCPVIDECLEYAISADEFGVWGGKTMNERRQMRRLRKKQVKGESSL